MESFSDADLASYATLFNPSSASDLVAFGLKKDVAECVMSMTSMFKQMNKSYKTLNAS